jgi:hypothetical protein
MNTLRIDAADAAEEREMDDFEQLKAINASLLDALEDALAGLQMAYAHVVPAMQPNMYRHLSADIAKARVVVEQAKTVRP